MASKENRWEIVFRTKYSKTLLGTELFMDVAKSWFNILETSPKLADKSIVRPGVAGEKDRGDSVN